ncbi:MAG: CehA/McbA family metallohydrolase [Proteobacteria bacterium]|nr:CehA/McbA family metallohydrolase [Pseudomonadota bacterium]
MSDTPTTTLERTLMDEPGYGRSPRVCADGAGRFWVAWISWDGREERVRVRCRSRDGAWGASRACTLPTRAVTGIALAGWGEGALLAWIDAGDAEADGLKLAELDADGDDGSPRLIVPWRRSPGVPALSTGSDAFALCWTVRTAGGCRVEGFTSAEPSAVSIVKPISEGRGSHLEPAAAWAGDAAWIAWQVMAPEESRIEARRVDGPAPGAIVEVADGGPTGVVARPSLAGEEGGGAWVAWSTDVDPAAGPGLVRWVEVAHLDRDGKLSLPAARMQGVDRGGRGEDQGLEAPALVLGEGGALVVAARGSQSLRRMDLTGAGWTVPAQLDEAGWKCRGRRFDACASPAGLLVVGRERDGLAARLLPYGPTDGGPPALAKEKPPARPVREHRAVRGIPIAVAGRRVLFGDIHQHTAASDGTGTAAEAFHRARWRYGDDLCAIADHESFLGKRTPPGEWAEHCRIADELYAPGEFVTLQAFEWTGAMHPGPGHKVVYVSSRGGPVLSRDDERTRTSSGLLAECRRVGALAFPHHVGWTGADADAHDPEVQSCWEIVSCHGAYERPGVGPIGTRGDDKLGQFAAEMLDRGLRFGFVGGSDGHGLNWHHGICRMADSHRAGLTGVLAAAATRDAVFEALGARRCYATSGAKIGVWFEVNGLPMGEEIPVNESVSFRLSVAATAEIESLALVTNGGREIRLEAGSTAVDAHGTLPAPPEGRWAYYYARVVQVDGHVAWSSPIWLDAIGSPGSGYLTA